MTKASLGSVALAVTVASWLGHVACGGDAGDDVFGGAATSGGGGDGTGGAVDVSVGVGAQGASTGEGGSPSATGPGPSSSSAGGSSSMMSSSSGMPDTNIPCGDSECNVSSDQACCWDAYNFYPAPQAECVSASADACQTQGGETLMTCAGPAECGAAEVCCADREFFQGQTFYITVACHSSCDWPDVLMCDPNVPAFPCPVVDTMQGPVQTECKPSQILPQGYFVCGLP